VQVWIRNDSMKNVAALAAALEKATKSHANREFKAFIIFQSLPKGVTEEAFTRQVAQIYSQHKLRNTSVSYLGEDRNEALEDYKISSDPKVRNTVLVYKNRRLDTKFVNFTADRAGVAALNTAIRKVL
jgi:hypothetical protein